MEKQLTQEEAEQLSELLGKLQIEFNNRLENGAYDGELFTLLVRNKYQRYLEVEYNV